MGKCGAIMACDRYTQNRKNENRPVGFKKTGLVLSDNKDVQPNRYY